MSEIQTIENVWVVVDCFNIPQATYNGGFEYFTKQSATLWADALNKDSVMNTRMNRPFRIKKVNINFEVVE